MKLDIYQVDAFASQIFEGNPAAVCPLEEWLSDSLMQSIAAENNLSETAFFVKENDDYRIRWFTPATEVDLCGHATLASAYILFNHLGLDDDRILFDSKSGPLIVNRSNDLIVLDFPAQPPQPCEQPPGLIEALGENPIECQHSDDLLVQFDSETTVRELKPDIPALKSLDYRGIIVTSAAVDYDFVARFFAPNAGIDEDPVTGSAYTKLIPYWSEKTGKQSFRARQVSSRGGDLVCELKGDRVHIGGKAQLYLKGQIEV